MKKLTTVVNVYHGKPADVYIGRAGKGSDGYFGNPHPIGYCRICKVEHNRNSAVAAYQKDFYVRILDPEFRRRVMELAGKSLACFCKPSSCHGDVIAAYLNGLESSE